MRRHAKASSAAPTQRQATGLGRIFRGAFATRASSSRGDGSGAPTGRGVWLAVTALVATFILISAPSADATQFQRPFKETFGSAAQPTIEYGANVQVEKSSGNVLLVKGFPRGAAALEKFKSDGTPLAFADLGGSTIDGEAGPGGKPCSEEPASCDQTPQGEIESPQSNHQLLVDESNGPARGDIYLGQHGGNLVDIFSSGGKYLGQLTGVNFGEFNGPCVTVDQSGAVYVADNINELTKFVPSANPVTNFNAVWHTSIPSVDNLCDMASGAGPTAGTLFAMGRTYGGGPEHLIAISEATGSFSIMGGTEPKGSFVIDPTDGTVIMSEPSSSGQFVELREFAPSTEVLGPVIGRTVLESEDLNGEPEAISQILDFALSGSGDLYVPYARFGALPTPLAVYGTPAVVPTVTLDAPSGVSGTKVTFTGAINPEGLEVDNCFFEYKAVGQNGWEPPIKCDGSFPIPADHSDHGVHASIAGLEPNGTEYLVRLRAKNENGTERSELLRFKTASTVTTEAATGIGLTSATLNGTLRPEGTEFESCFFEYGLSSSASFEGKVACSPPAVTIEPDFAPHSVSTSLSNLQTSRKYRYRVVADGKAGDELTFTTFGAPTFTELRARDAGQSSLTLEAKINPGGFGTSYHFEWGTGTGYGNDVPAEYEPFVGSGTSPVLVTAKLKGLSPATIYHYRVVANNEVGVSSSPDHEAETLNSCGLPERRCFELVSPRDAGPTAYGAPGLVEPVYQAAEEPGTLAFAMEGGLPDATKGGSVLYRGSRGSSSWAYNQLSPPLIGRSELSGQSNYPSKVVGFSEDLSCGVTESAHPLTADASMRAVIEAGGSNLYRINSDGSYTGITNLPPANASEVEAPLAFRVIGFSANCSKVVFETQYRYPGLPTLPGENEFVYEWDQGSLRRLGFLPGSGGEEIPVAATPGSRNGVSANGSRVFFSINGNVYVREDGTTSRDLSVSETSTPVESARFLYATKDGSRVYFTANAGLTDESSLEGTDLYEYDLENEDLTDLSVGSETGGAAVAGFIGASKDGSHVYFVARGQLVPGGGRSFAQNVRDQMYSVYSEVDGQVSYVGPVKDVDLEYAVSAKFISARVTPDGRFLLFASEADVTGYPANEVRQAYLFDADDSAEPVVCVTCRQDGRPSVTPAKYEGLQTPYSTDTVSYLPQSLVERGGKPVVFFGSWDTLAPGSSAGRVNFYEWSHGQIFRIATEPPDLKGHTQEPELTLTGASSDGTDAYFITPETLTWEDGDERQSYYDARIGGGYTQPPAPPAPCQPASEGSCQTLTPAGAPGPAAATPTFVGPGNQHPAKKHKKKKKHKKTQKKNARHANAKRGAAK